MNEVELKQKIYDGLTDKGIEMNEGKSCFYGKLIV